MIVRPTVRVCPYIPRIQSFPRSERVSALLQTWEKARARSLSLSLGPSIDRTDQFLRESQSQAHFAGKDRGEDQETVERPCCLLCFPVVLVWLAASGHTANRGETSESKLNLEGSEEDMSVDDTNQASKESL